MTDRGLGFVFVTTDIDSSGVVWAAHLEGVHAPVLVVDWYDDFFEELDLPPGLAPLHFLIDSTAAIHGGWSAQLFNEECCEKLLGVVDLWVPASDSLGHQ